MQGLRDKVFLVTGASSGIGQAIAVRLAEEGAHIVIHYGHDLEGAQKTEHDIEAMCEKIKDCQVDHLVVKADVSDEEAIDQLFNDTLKQFGRLDGLINNAGIQIAADSQTMTRHDFDKVLNINLRGSFLCAQRAIRQFLTQPSRGTVLNVSSVHEVIPKPKYVGYSVSKGGLRNLTHTLALEFASQGIRVNGIGPGATVTPINNAWIHDAEATAQVAAHIPMRRVGHPTEMAAAAAFLLSDEATYITGQTLFIDGGLTLYPSFESAWSS